MPRIRKSGDGGLYPVRRHGCGQVDGKWKCGNAKPSACPRSVVVKWKGVVDVGFKADGSRDQKAVTSRSQSIARQKLEALKAEIASTGSPLGNQTVAEWGASWLESVRRTKPQTYRTRKSVLKKWVFPVIERKNLKDVRPSDLQRIYANMREAGKSGATALKAHTVMSTMFEAARLERLVSINVTNDVRPPKALKSTRDTFTPDETLRLLKAAEMLPDGTKWIVSLYAGIRQGERLGATVDSIDFNLGRFTVQWSLVEANYEHGCGGDCGRKSGWCRDKRLVIPDGIEFRRLWGRYLLVPPKSGESRTFPLPADLLARLERHVGLLGNRAEPYGLLWPDAVGNPISGRDDQQEWQDLLALAKVDRPGATTHWARHTAISDLTAAGVPERVTGEMVGHRSPGITGRYQHVSSLDAADAMGKLVERRSPH